MRAEQKHLSARRILKNPRQIFSGWWLVISGGILCLWGYGYSSYGISALFKPISGELGFTRAQTSVALSITRFEGGIEAPVVGYLADRYGPRGAVMLGVLLVGLGLILMYRVNSLWSFYLVWAGIFSSGINISLSMPLDVAITNWFRRRRGTALSIKQFFSGLSGVIVLPLIAWLIVTYGWRNATLIGGIVMLAAGLPLTWLFIKPRPPEYYGLLPDGAAPEADLADNEAEAAAPGRRRNRTAVETDFTVGQALRTRTFWMLIAAFMFHSSLTSVMSIHAIPFLTDRGMDPVAAAATMSVYVFASLPARFFGGLLCDRMSTRSIRFVMAGSYLLQFLGVGLFLLNRQSLVVLYLFFILYGVGMGGAMPVLPAIRARYFGRKHFGKIAGISRAFNMPVGIAGPVASGWIYDTTGSYHLAFIVFGGVLLASALIMALAGPPKASSGALASVSYR